MTIPPKWAQDLTLQVALDEDRDDVPDIVWRRRRGPRLTPGMKTLLRGVGRDVGEWMRHARSQQGTSGHYRWSVNRITLTAGGERQGQKLILLHELAHWLSPRGEHHGDNFWDTAWRLYRRYRIPIRFAREREGSYRKGALAAYRRSTPQ